MPASSPLFDAYLDGPRRGTRFWRALLGLVLIIACWVATTVLFVLLSAVGVQMVEPEWSSLVGWPDTPEALLIAIIDGELSGAAALVGLLGILLSFSGIWLGVWLAQLLLKAPLSSLISAMGHIRWRRGLQAAGVTLLAMLVLGLVDASWEWERYRLQAIGPLFGLGLLMGVLLIPLQAGAEELLFRGWLVQQIGRLSRNPWLLGGLTSAGFALLHGANAEAATYGFAAYLAYAAVGAVLFWTVWREGGIEVAFGIHTANNLFAFFWLKPSDSEGFTHFGNETLFYYEGAYELTALRLLGMVLFYLLILVLLYWRRSPLRLPALDREAGTAP